MIETLPAGTELRGRYRIERILGSGGFGHVYLALDKQSKQLFAVKEYLVTGASGRAQLEHEARVLSKLHHPSLPAFQDSFDELGRYYVVLGYIEGSDLTDCLRMVRQKNEMLSYDCILTWLISICDAVTFLHNQRPPVIHRDIKPDNIRITPGGTATLVDLGNAKATEDGARTLFFIRHQGTPGYAPLEQYPGGTGTDARSDVYALGGTLYFALTAHEPPSVSTRNASISQGLPDLPTMQEILAQNPPETPVDPNAGKQFRLGISKPSRPAPRHSRHIAQLATLPPDLLNRLNAIIQRAMAMRPKDRYQSVADMSKDLREVQTALTASQAPSPLQRRFYDPHSTQPDLQFLVDAWEDNQRTDTPPGQVTPAPTARPQASPPAQDSTPRCPNCGADLPKLATFCPKCGQPLSGKSSRNNQGQSSTTNSSQNTNNAKNPKDMSSGPTMLYTPSQPSALPRPFLQTVSPSSLPASTGSPVAPSLQIAQEVRYARSSSATPAAPSPLPANSNHPVPPAGIAGGTPIQKLLRYAILVFAAILLIILLLLLSHLGAGH
jgi:serine/threonine protein kinase